MAVRKGLLVFLLLLFCAIAGSSRGYAGNVYYVDNRHPQPSDENPGTREAPFLTIQAAADMVAPGDTVKIRPGRYREGVLINQPGVHKAGERYARRITFEADYSEGPGEVILDGSWRVPDDAWQLHPGHENVYVASMQRPAAAVVRAIHTVPAAPPRWVFVEEELILPHSPDRSFNTQMLADGDVDRWHCDHENSLLYVNLGGRRPEAVDISVRFHAFGGWKYWQDYVTFRGLTIQRYSHRAIPLGKETWVEDCLIRHSEIGVAGGENSRVVRNTFLDIGGTAIDAGTRMICAENIAIRFYLDPFLTRNFYSSTAFRSFSVNTFHVIRNNVFVDDGSLHKGYAGIGGIWFDNPSPGNFVYGNTIARVGMGMYIEYPMMSGLVTWNTVSDSREGLVLRHNAANSIVENYISRIRDAGIKLQGTETIETPLMRDNFIARNYLEDCGIGILSGADGPGKEVQTYNTANRNVYNLKEGQVAANWAGKVYDTLEEFREGTGMEMHGRTGELSPEDMGLVSFRIADSKDPWSEHYMFGNPRLARQQWTRADVYMFPGIPYLYSPGVEDGSIRRWITADDARLRGDIYDWPVEKRRSADNHSAGMSWYYTSTEPFTAMVAAALHSRWVAVRNFRQEERGLRGRSGADGDAHLQVMAREPNPAPETGVGWYTVSMPTAPGAVIDAGFWMGAISVEPAEKNGGAIAFVEWSDYTRSRVARSFILGYDERDVLHNGDFVSGSFDYSRIEGTVTAPSWARRFRLFMGIRSAVGILQFDDIDTIRTRPADPPAVVRADAPSAPYDPDRLDFRVLDLSGYFNRTLSETLSDDGVDMSGVSPNRRVHQGVPFSISGSLECVVLRSSHDTRMPVRLKMTVGEKAEMVYFLHALSGREEMEHWRYVIRYADGLLVTEERIPLTGGVNIRDWTDVIDVLTDEFGTWRAYAAESTGGAVHPRQSLWVLEWKNPRPDVEIESIEAVSAGRGIPILLGITLGQRR